MIPTAGGLFLTQHKYIRDIFESTGMAGAKEVYTPNSVLNLMILPRLMLLYFGGSLGSYNIWLSQKPLLFISQFMHRPSQQHWQLVKRLI